MSPNPFSPSFAILPSSFFGRRSYIETYERALDTYGSAWQCLMLTGTRGSGKTSLLYQFELRARERSWDVIRGTTIDITAQLLRYVGIERDTSISASLKPSFAVTGMGSASLGELTSTSVTPEARELLSPYLRRKVSRFHINKGLAIIVDEAQKLAKDDAVLLSNAVQDARSEGLPVSLVLGGLPSAYPRLRSLQDVTFLRRMKREKLWTMPKSETVAFLRTSFAKVPEMDVSEEQLMGIAAFSGGHPYLMQLVGDNLYRLAEEVFDPLPGARLALPDELIEAAQSRSLVEYKENVLDDVLKGTHTGTRDYIAAAYELRDARGYVSTSQIDARFGKNAHEMSSRRAAALNTQVLKVAKRGKLKFALPHYPLIFEHLAYEEPETTEDEWDF